MDPLKTDYKDDIYQGNRKYIQTKNDDGTVSFSDATQYEQEGDYFGSKEINEISQAVNEAFQSASNGKQAIKTAITGVDPSVTIPTDATFQQLASAIGQIKTGVNTDDATATAEQILAGMIAYIKEKKVVGTMPNNGAVNQSLPINGTYAIPKGYHDGSGKVTQSIPTKAAQIYTPNTVDQTIALGQYLSGAQTLKGDPNLVAANILSGKSIFGVDGNVVAGKRWASGTAVSGSAHGTYEYLSNTNKETSNLYPLVVTGLTFLPSVIILNAVLDSFQSVSAYDNFSNSVIVMAANKGAGSSTTTYTFKPNAGTAYVDSSGFALPVIYSGISYTWKAYE